MDKKFGSVLVASVMTLAGQAGEIDARAAFQSQCLLCHTTRPVSPGQKEKLLGPPADEVMFHVKEKYPIKEDAVAFMADYVLAPAVDKALCASMDKFGLMPSMKSSVTPREARSIAGMMFDRFPRAEFSRQEKKSRKGITFATIDTDKNGFISPEEFRNFRARRNGINPREFKGDLFFRKVDRNGDGKMSPEEFETMLRVHNRQN